MTGLALAALLLYAWIGLWVLGEHPGPKCL